MVSRADILQLLRRPRGAHPVLSVFLDMTVNAENRRTHLVFLRQRRGQYVELASDRPRHHREALGAAFERVERWLEERYVQANKGVAVYAEVGGEWLHGLQLPVALRNRTVIADRPVVGPLAEVVESERRHGLVLVDRERLRLIDLYLGEPLHEHAVSTEPYPAPHDVQRGGYAAIDLQRRKTEEVRHFFKEFALEVAEFDRRYRPDDLVLLGTEENVKNFVEFLAAPLREKVAHTAHVPLDAPTADVLERLGPWLVGQRAAREAAAVGRVRDRVAHGHLAVAGFPATLEQLQEGKVAELVLARDIERVGAVCTRCGFYLAEGGGACPYCGGPAEDRVDLVEAMVRLAEEQDVPIAFVSPESLADLGGVAALLRF